MIACAPVSHDDWGEQWVGERARVLVWSRAGCGLAKFTPARGSPARTPRQRPPQPPGRIAKARAAGDRRNIAGARNRVAAARRSEERRVGKECRARWAACA